MWDWQRGFLDHLPHLHTKYGKDDLLAHAISSALQLIIPKQRSREDELLLWFKEAQVKQALYDNEN
jgi:hypothetical protein